MHSTGPNATQLFTIRKGNAPHRDCQMMQDPARKLPAYRFGYLHLAGVRRKMTVPGWSSIP
jgi:hypothetical protein